MTDMEKFLLKYLANLFIDHVDKDDKDQARRMLGALDLALHPDPFEKTEMVKEAKPEKVEEATPESYPAPNQVIKDSLGNQI